MNPIEKTPRLAAFGGLGLSLTLALSGCLNLKPVADPARYFVLSSIPLQEALPAPHPAAPAIGLGFITLPDYLKGNRLASRQGTHEIRYHEWLLWAEDLDKGLLRVLGLNLQSLLATRDVYLLDWDRSAIDLEVHLTLFQFEPNDQGLATLEAAWKITRPGGLEVVRSGTSLLQTNAPLVSEDPAGTVTALSGLAADFSRELAEVLHELLPAEVSPE